MSSHSRPSSAVGLGDKELERGRSQMKMSTSNGGTSCFDSRVSSCRLDTRDVRGTGSLPFLYIIYCIFVILHTAWMWFWVQFFLILHCFNHRPYTAADSWWTRAWSTLSPFTLSASLLLSLKANVKIWATAGVAAPYVGLYIYIYIYTHIHIHRLFLLWPTLTENLLLSAEGWTAQHAFCFTACQALHQSTLTLIRGEMFPRTRPWEFSHHGFKDIHLKWNIRLPY